MSALSDQGSRRNWTNQKKGNGGPRKEKGGVNAPLQEKEDSFGLEKPHQKKKKEKGASFKRARRKEGDRWPDRVAGK